ncbi:MAG: hypothetical protein RRZ38_14965, partial [Hafnia sp.]
MKNNSIPKISLFNIDDKVESTLLSNKFNIHSYKLNGKVNYLQHEGQNYNSFTYYHDVPSDLHESEVIIIDLNKSKTGRISDGNPFEIYFQKTPPFIDLMPFDVSLIRDNIRSSIKKRCVIVFCDKKITETYKLVDPKTKNYDEFTFSSVDLGLYLRVINKNGVRYKAVDKNKDNPISKCVCKYAENLSYNIVFESSMSNDTQILTNESNDTIAWYRIENESLFIFLPDLEKKELFLSDLLMNVLPDIEFLSELFPNNGSFLWENDPIYISKEEKDILQKEKDIEQKYIQEKEILSRELTVIRAKDENRLLKNLLKETDDELVYAVEWFLNYIGFENIQRPDEHVKDGDVFEEDLRI